MAKKKRDSSWKNMDNYSKGKERLKNGILQHPEEDSGDKSVYNYMVGQMSKRKEFTKILPFERYKSIGKNINESLNIREINTELYKNLTEDMLAPADSPFVDNQGPASTPGELHQTPKSMSGDMDLFSLTGPSKETKKKKPSKKENKDKPFGNSTVLNYEDFVQNKKK